MSARQGARKALVLSPSASHPQDYGNRNRVFQTTSRLKDAGFEIHFLLYPYESDWVNGVPDSAVDMRAAWDPFTVIPPSLISACAARKARITTSTSGGTRRSVPVLEWLFAREAFDVFLVNYTFFSEGLRVRAQDRRSRSSRTHDIFSGRKELFQAHGAQPEFFYTTPEQEKQALDRAGHRRGDHQGRRKRTQLRALTSREVVADALRYRRAACRKRRPERLETAEPSRSASSAHSNTVNSLNMARFLERFAKAERIYVPPPIEIRIAGNVCSQLRAYTSPSVKLLGHVPSVAEYYEDIDVVVAPMSFSTGIKIKVGEALSFGKPVVATHNGFDGFPSTDEFHSLESIDAVCRALMKLAFDRERLKTLEDHSEVAARLARSRSAAGYGALARAIGRLVESRRLHHRPGAVESGDHRAGGATFPRSGPNIVRI